MKISRQKIALAFLIIGLVFALALGLLAFFATRLTLETVRRESRTFEVISKIKRVSVDINTMQGEVRGYLLTGDPGYLEVYEAAQEDYLGSMDELSRLVAESPDDMRRVKAVEELASGRIAILNESISHKKKGAVPLSIVYQGEAANRQINRLIDEMVLIEKEDISGRQRGHEAEAREALFLIAAASALSLLLVVSAVLVVRRDYAYRRRLEEELRQSEKKYRVVADNTAAWEFWTAPDNRVLYCSPSCLPISGHAAAEFENDPGLLSRIVHEDDLQRFMAHDRELHGAKSALVLEYRIVCPDKSVKWISQVCRPIFDEAGEFLGTRGTNRDITNEKRLADLNIKNSREIEDLYNNAPCAYHSLDKGGLFVRINDTALRWLGYSREEVVGRLRVTDIMSERSLEVFRERFAAFKENGNISDLELEFRRKDGTIMPVLLNATAIKDSAGNFLMSRSTYFDVTELFHARRAIEEKNEELTEALSRVKQLSGLLPICASCKKIRDDLGYWNSIEKYIGEHSEAEFTHSICPDCVKKLYPELADKIIKE